MLYLFVSDGCSCFPDGNWLECCNQHDKLYQQGGSPIQRKSADIGLLCCVAGKGHPIIAFIMYLGVRVAGLSWLPTPFRWGFGIGKHHRNGTKGRNSNNA